MAIKPMAIKPMATKSAPSARTAVMPRGKQPVKPKAGRMPGAMPTKPAPRPGVARPAVMPRKQAPSVKPVPVGKSKPRGTAIKPIPVVGNKIIKSLPVKNNSNINKSRTISKVGSNRSQDIMKAIGK